MHYKKKLQPQRVHAGNGLKWKSFPKCLRPLSSFQLTHKKAISFPFILSWSKLRTNQTQQDRIWEGERTQDEYLLKTSQCWEWDLLRRSWCLAWSQRYLRTHAHPTTGMFKMLQLLFTYSKLIMPSVHWCKGVMREDGMASSVRLES